MRTQPVSALDGLACSIQLSEHLSVLERLITVVQELSLARHLDTIMVIVRKAARALTGADGASFVLRENDQCFYADEDAIAPLWKGQRFPMSICLGGWVMNNRQPAVIGDIVEDARVPYAAYSSTFVKSLAMVPIRTLQPIGAIGVYWATLHAPTVEEVKLLQALADTTAVAMENVQVYEELEQRVCDRTAQLQTLNQRLFQEVQEREAAEAIVRKLSVTDELTGLHNRRGFFLLAELQLKVAYRTKNPCFMIFVDLDGLKTINDTLGHEVGDRAIHTTGQILKQTFRDSDILARLGGDEFAVFVSTSSDDAAAIEARLYQNIAQFNAGHQLQYQLSMSVGIQPCDLEEEIPLEQLLAQADGLMYEEKRLRKLAMAELA